MHTLCGSDSCLVLLGVTQQKATLRGRMGRPSSPRPVVPVPSAALAATAGSSLELYGIEPIVDT